MIYRVCGFFKVVFRGCIKGYGRGSGLSIWVRLEVFVGIEVREDVVIVGEVVLRGGRGDFLVLLVERVIF